MLKNISDVRQIVGVSWVCDQNGDSVSMNDKSCHISSMRQKRFCKIRKIWDSVFILVLSRSRVIACQYSAEVFSSERPRTGLTIAN